MADDSRVHMAGMVGHEFKIDPITVLKADTFEWSVRLAAAKYVQEERAKAEEEARKKAKQHQSSRRRR